VLLIADGELEAAGERLSHYDGSLEHAIRGLEYIGREQHSAATNDLDAMLTEFVRKNELLKDSDA
jgi:hypothetical protein